MGDNINKTEQVKDNNSINNTTLDKNNDISTEKLGFFDQQLKGITPDVLANSSFKDNVYLEKKDDVINKLKGYGYNDEEALLRYNAIKNTYDSMQIGLFDNEDKQGTTQASTWDKLGYKSIGYTTKLRNTQIRNESGDGYYNAEATNSYLDTDKYYTEDEKGNKVAHDLNNLNAVFNPRLIVKQDYDKAGVPVGNKYIFETPDWHSNVMETPYNIFSGNHVFGEANILDDLAGFTSGLLVTGTMQVIGGLSEITGHLLDVDKDDNTYVKTIKNTIANISTPEAYIASKFGDKNDKNSFGYGKNGAVSIGEVISNLSRRWAYNPSEEIATDGFMGSGSAFMFNTAKGIGEFIPQIIGIAESGGALAFAEEGGKIAAKQLIKTAGKEIVEKGASGQLTKTILQKSVQALGKESTHVFASIGAAQGMSAIYNEMAASGVDKKTAAGFGVAAAPWIYATEMVIGTKWIKGVIGVNEFQIAVNDAMRKTLGTFVENEASKIGTDEGIRTVTHRFAKNLFSAFKKSSAKEASTIGKEETARAAAKNFKNEFGKIFGAKFEGMANKGAQAINGLNELEVKLANSIFNPVSFVKGAVSEGLQETLEQTGYSNAYWAYDTFMAPDDATVGHGRMGYGSGNGRDYMKAVFGRKAMRSYKESFIGGAAIGGLAAGVMGRRGNGITDKNYLAMAKYNGQENSVFQSYVDNPSMFGSDKMDPSYNVLENNGTDKVAEVAAEDLSFTNKNGEEQILFKKGQSLTSQREVNMYHAVLDAKTAFSLIDQQGFSPDIIDSFIKQEGLLTRGFHVFEKMKKSESSIKNLETEYEAEKDKDKKSKLKERIDAEKGEYKKLSDKYQYLVGRDNTVSKLRNKIDNNNKEIVNLKKILESGEYNAEHILKIKEEISKRKEIINNEESSEEEKAQAKEEISKYNELLTSKKLTDADKLELRSQLSDLETKNTTYESQIKNSKEDSGYSLAYKDSIKNALSLMAFSNDIAYEKSGIKIKKDALSIDEIKNEDLESFMKIRNAVVKAMASENIYNNIMIVESIINENIANIKTRNETYLKSKEESLGKSKEVKNNLNELKAKLKTKVDFNDVKALNTHINNIIESINKVASNMDIDNNPGMASAIDSDFIEVESLLSNFKSDVFGTAADMQVDIMDMEGDEKEASTIILESLKHGGNELNKFEEYGSRQHAMSKSEAEIEKSISDSKTEGKLRDNVMFNQIDEFVETLDKAAKEKYKGQSLLGLDKQIEIAKNNLENFKTALKIRKLVFNEMEKTNDRKYLDGQDRTITNSEYESAINKIKKYNRSLEKHGEAIKSIIGSNSNYQTVISRGEARMNIHALKLMFDNSLFNKIVDTKKLKIKLAEAEKLGDITDDPAEITEQDKLDLEKAESIINDIFNELWQYRSEITNKEVIKNLLENSFLGEAAFEAGENKKARAYMNRAFNNRGKIDLYKNIDSYTSYNNTTSWLEDEHGNGIGYSHFINTLVKLGSDISQKKINQTRIDEYNENTKASSKEQLLAENEAIAFLLGGNKTFEIIHEVENEINEKNGIKLQYQNNLSRHRKNSLMITGEVQTGKTMQITPSIINIINNINPDKQFVLVSFSEDTKSNFDELLNTFNDEIKKKISILSNEEILNEDKDISNSIIFWDEATLLSENDIDKITKLTSENNSQIAYLGDASQMQTIIGDNAVENPFVEYIGFKTTPITQKYAVKNPMVAELMESYRSINGEGNTNLKWWKETINGYYKGVEYENTISDVIIKFLDRLNEIKGENDIVLAFLSNEQYEKWAEKFPELKAVEKYIKVLSLDPTKNERIDTIQGGRRKEVYIAYDASKEESVSMNKKVNNKSTRNSAMYTLIGRTSSFVMMPGIKSNKYTSRPGNFNAVNESPNYSEIRDNTIKYIENVYNIKKGTELKKETSTKINESETTNTKEQNTTLSIISKIGNDNEFSIDENGIVIKNGIEHKRVSSVIGYSNEPILSKSNKVSPFVRIQANIGTVLDTIMRDYFNDSLKQREDYILDKEAHSFKGVDYEESHKPLFENDKMFNKYIKSLEDFKKEVEGRGEIIVAKNTRFFIKAGEHYFTGEPDVMTISRDGSLNIYDLKGKRLNVGGDNIEEVINEPKEWYGNKSAFEKNSLQVNGYAELIENDERTGGLIKVNKANGLRLIYLGHNDRGNLNSISNIYDFKIKHVEPLKTNISELLKADKAKKGISKSIDKHYKAIKGNKYKNKNGDVFTIIDILKTGRNASIKVMNSNGNISEYPYSEFSKKFSIQKEEDSSITYPEIVNLEMTTNATLFKKSGNEFINNMGVYATPVSISVESINDLGLEPTRKNLEDLKALKGFIGNDLSYNLEFRPQMQVYNDDGKESEFKNNIVLVVKNTSENRDLIANYMHDFFNVTDNIQLSSIMNSILQSKLIPNIISEHYVLAYPEYEYGGNEQTKIHLKTGSKEEVDKAIEQIESGFTIPEGSSLTENDRENTIELNVYRVKMLAKAINNYNDNQETIISDNITLLDNKAVAVPGPKVKDPVNLTELINKEKNRGFKFGIPKLINGANGIYLGIKYSFKEGEEGIMQVYTPTLASMDSIDKDVFKQKLNDIKESLSKAKTFKDINTILNGSALQLFLYSNSKTIKSKSLLNTTFVINGIPEKLGNYFTIRNGRYESQRLTGDKVADEVKAYTFLIDVLDDYFSKGNQYLSFFDQLRIPFDKNNRDLSSYEVYHKRLNIPNSYIDASGLISENNNEDYSSDLGVPFSTKGKRILDYNTSLDEARGIISKILGDTSANEWTEFKEGLKYDNIPLFGMMKAGKLYYDIKNGKTTGETIRHEILHLVKDYLISDKVKSEIELAAKKSFKGGENMTSKELDEALANWYGKNGEKYTEKRYSGLLGKFRLLLDKILGRYKLYSGDLNKFFTDIEHGEYKQSFKEFAERNNPTHTNIKFSAKNVTEPLDIELENVTDEQSTDYTRRLYKDDIKAGEALIKVLGNKQIIKATSYANILFKNNSILGSGKFMFSDNIKRFLNSPTTGVIDYKIGIFDGKKYNTKKASQLSGKDIHLIVDDKNFGMYLHYHINTNEDFRRALLKQVFPSLNMKEAAIKGKRQSYGDDSKRIKITEKTSDIIKWFNSSITYYDKNGLAHSPIAQEQVDSILRKAASLSVKQTGGDDYALLLKGLKTLIKGDGSRYDNEVKSIYAALSNGNRHMAKYGQKGLVESQNNLNRFIKTSQGEIKNITQAKLDELEDFKYHYASLYKSISENSIIDIKLEKNFDKIIKKKQRDESTQKEAVKQSLMNVLLNHDGTITNKIKEVHQKTETDSKGNETKLYDIKDDGMYIGGVQVIQYNNGKARFTEKGLTLNVLADLRYYTGLVGLNLKTLVSLSRNHEKMNKVSNNAFKGGESLHMSPSDYLASVFMLFSMSIDSHINQETLVEKYLENHSLDDIKNLNGEEFNPKINNDKIESIRKKLIPKYIKTFNDDVISQITNGEEKSNLNFETPTNYYDILSKLGEANFNNMSLSSNRFVYINGKKRMLQDMNNSILDLFSRGVNADNDYTASDHIISEVEDNINENGLPDNAYYDIEGNSNNVMLPSVNTTEKNGKIISDGHNNNTPIIKIIESSEMPGIRNDYTSSNDMTRKDRFRAFMSVFMNSVTSIDNNSNVSKLVVPLGFNKRDYVLSLELERSPKLGHWYGIDKDSSGKIKNIFMNDSIVNKSLSMKFDYYRKANLKSLSKWKTLFKYDFLSFKNEDIALNAINDINVNNLKRTLYEITPEDEAAIKKNLTKEKDYYFKDKIIEISKEEALKLKEKNESYATKELEGGGTKYYKTVKAVGFGKATRFQVTGSFAYNYNNYKKIQQNGLTNELRSKIFFTDLKNNISYLNNLLDDRYGIKDYFSNTLKEGETLINEFYKKDNNDKISVNPFFELMFYLTHIGMSNAGPLVYGNDMNSKNLVDYVKRNNSSRTGRTMPAFGHRLALSRKSKIIIVKSNRSTRVDGGTIENKDGQVSGSLLYKVAFKHNFGGDAFMQFDNTMYKDLSSGADLGTSNDLLQKEAIDFTSSELIERFPKLKTIQMNMLKMYNTYVRNAIDVYNQNNPDNPIEHNVDLYKKFNEIYNDNNDFEKSAEIFWSQLMDLNNKSVYSEGEYGSRLQKQQILKDNLIKGFSDETTIKRGLHNVNDVNMEEAFDDNILDSITPTDVDNTKMGIVINPGHDIDEQSTNAIMNQVLSHIGTGIQNKSISNAVETSMINIIDLGEEKFFNEFGVSSNVESWGEDDISRFKSNLRNMAISSQLNIKNSAMLDLLLSGASLDIPQITETVKQIFRNKYNNSAITPRFKGYKANQASAEAMTMYHYNGMTLTYQGLKKVFYNNENEIKDYIANGTIVEKELDYMHHELNDDGSYTFHKSEIIAPYMYKNKFGLTDEFSNYDVSDVYTMTFDEDGDYVTINIQNKVDELMENSNTEEEFRKGLEKYIKEEFNGQLESHPAINYAFNEEAKNEESIGKDMTTEMLLKHLSKYFYNFRKSLDVTVNRLPFDSPRLGFIAKIVSFSEGNGNTIYINPKENVRSGGDFDIDQLSVYFRSFNNDISLNQDLNTIDGNVNTIINSIESYYQNEKNYNSLYGETSTKKIESLVDRNIDKKKAFKEQLAVSTLASTIESSGNITDGNGAIGVLALSSSAYALLIQKMNTKDVGSFLYQNWRNTEGTKEINKRILRLSNFLQLALDNDKLMLLGQLNIPKKLTGIITALIANGKTEEEIYHLFASEETKYSIGRIVNQVKAMENIDESSTNIQLLIKNNIEYEQEQINDLKSKYRGVKDIENQIKILNARIKAYSNVDELTEEQEKEFEATKTRYKELSRIVYSDKNIQYMKDFYKASIAGEGLRRFGRFISNRSGIKAVDIENKFKRRELEAILGQDMGAYLKADKSISLESQLDYYKSYNNEYRKSEHKEDLLKIEEDIRKALDVPSLIKKFAYFHKVLESIHRDAMIMEKTFFSDHPIFDEIEADISEKQNRNSFEYKTQMSVLNNLKSEIIVGHYFNANNISVNLNSPKFSNEINDESIYNFDHPFEDLNLSSRENRKVFTSVFPEYIMNVKDIIENNNLSDEAKIDYFSKIGVDINKRMLSAIKNNSFFEYITKQGFEENVRIEIDPNISLDNKRIADINLLFKALPEKIQKLFQYYAIIQTNMQYKQRSLSSVINMDIYNDISKKLTTRMLDNIDENEINKISDYLGMNSNIARFFKETDKPMYVLKNRLINNSLVNSYNKYTGKMEGRVPVLVPMIRTIYNIGYQLKDKSEVWLPDIQSIKVNGDQETALRSDPSKNVLKKFLKGSSYRTGYATTSSGMIVNLKTNKGKVVVISKNANSESVIDNLNKKADNKVLNTNFNLNNENIINNIKKGKDFTILLNYDEIKNNFRLKSTYKAGPNTSMNDKLDFTYYDKETGLKYYFTAEITERDVNKNTADGFYSHAIIDSKYQNNDETKVAYKITEITSQTKLERIFDYMLNKNNENEDDDIECKKGGSGTKKASNGMQSGFTKGGQWNIVKDLKGMPSHKQGGVQLSIENGNIHFERGDSKIHAKYGLIINNKI